MVTKSQDRRKVRLSRALGIPLTPKAAQKIIRALEIEDPALARELLLGSRHFNELRRGNPKMSPALLSKRLRRLERAGVVRRRVVGGRSTYELTESGLELRGVVDALGAWGARCWAAFSWAAFSWAAFS